MVINGLEAAGQRIIGLCTAPTLGVQAATNQKPRKGCKFGRRWGGRLSHSAYECEDMDRVTKHL